MVRTRSVASTPVMIWGGFMKNWPAVSLTLPDRWEIKPVPPTGQAVVDLMSRRLKHELA